MNRKTHKLLTAYLGVSFIMLYGVFLWLVSANDRNPDGGRESDVAVLMPPVFLLTILIGQMFAVFSIYLMGKAPEIEILGCKPISERSHPNLTRLLLNAPLVLGVVMILWALLNWIKL